MSIAYLAMAFKTELPPNEKIVLLFLAENANEWGFVTPGHKAIAEATRLSPRTIVTITKNLQEKGYIRHYKTAGRPTIFQLRGDTNLIPAITPESPYARPEIKQPHYDPVEDLSRSEGDLSSSANSALVQDLHESRPPSSPPNGFPPDPLSLTPLLSPHSGHISRVREENSYTEKFLAFWSVYPVHRAKAYAFKCWTKKKLDKDETLADTVIAHVVRRKKRDKQWLQDGGKYIPHPSTFLNQSLWEDEYESTGIDDGPQYRHGLPEWDL